MNIELFLQKMTALKKRPSADLPALEVIEQWVLSGAHDFFTQRLIPLRLSEQAQLSVKRLVSELLYAVPVGLFDLNWEVRCPHCHATTNTYNHLSQGTGLDQCQGCEKEFKVDFARWVDVTFSLNLEIDDRQSLPVSCELPEGIQSFFNLEVNYSDTQSAAETIIEPGQYRYVCPITKARGILVIEGNNNELLQEFNLQLVENHFQPNYLQAYPGQIKINLTNLDSPIAHLQLVKDDLPPHPLTPHLAGLDLIHYPAFRTLFGDQVLSEREQMQVASVTTLFTDITGSTAMYERLGDVVAYNRVRDHFEILFTQIEQHGGIVLKTIGDAVMASFTSNKQALLSIINVLENFKQYNNHRQVDEHIHIKIGIHRGPAILVNLNNQLDYFGSTINKAARIQSLADSGEICFSEPVYQDNAFRQVLKEWGIKEVSHHSVNLKGIEGIQTVYKAVTAIDKMTVI